MSFLRRGPGLEWLRRNLPRMPLLVNLTWGLFRDPRVPVSLKAALLGALAYVASPIDLIPDFIPGFGQVDDLVVLIAAFEMFVRFAPPEVVEELLARYEQGHRPLRDDLRSLDQNFGRLLDWARRRVAGMGKRYAERVRDRDYVVDVEHRSTGRSRESTPQG